LRKTLGLERPYLLAVGTIEPRKNLSFLVDVFEALNVEDLDLVIAGKPGWKCEPIFKRLEDSCRADRIRYVNHVPDAGLPALYAGAELMVVPSLYEGFGFPPLEAMACGTPVLSSAGGSLPEVLGAAALVVPGFERDCWKEAIERLLGDSGLRDRLIRAGLERAARFRWETTARKTWELYRSLAA
jgi:glycosyltransferase involved in cell wall biosynthesis